MKVAEGDHVEADTVVAETFMDGDITPLNVANLLGAQPGDVPSMMLKGEGEPVEKDEVIARNKGIFGMFKNECRSPATGTIQTVSATTGQIMIAGPPIPVQVKAYMPGRVSAVLPGEGVVVENRVALIQGIFGVGGETSGPIRIAVSSHDEELDAEAITDEMSGAIIIGGARVTAAAIERAREVGAAAVVSGGIDDSDLKRILGYDLGVAITERATRGHGRRDRGLRRDRHGATHLQLLSARAGREASVNGATNPSRRHAMEILIPFVEGDPVDGEQLDRIRCSGARTPIGHS